MKVEEYKKSENINFGWLDINYGFECKTNNNYAANSLLLVIY